MPRFLRISRWDTHSRKAKKRMDTKISWLLPMRPALNYNSHHLPFKNVNISDSKKFYIVSKDFFEKEEDRQRIVRTYCAIKTASEQEKVRKLALRPKIIPLRECPSSSGKPMGLICEATLMNGLRCSSKAKCGKYCGRHKLN